jgi:phosphatidate cytidylyltransferase
MHLKRWITGIIGAAFLVFIISIGTRWPFYLFLFITSLIGLNEFFNLTAKGIPRFLRFSGYILSFILFLIITLKQILLLPVVILLFLAVPLIFQMLTYGSSDKRWDKTILEKAVIGPIYISLPVSMLILIDMGPGGKIWIFFLLAVIFANDTGALYAGKIFGRHKLYREVSPNKTWEGAVGGLFLCLIIACIFLKIDILKVHSLDIGIIFLVAGLSIAAQIGDLVESMIKRTHDIKDSGSILPGHGGLLDRIDGLLFAVPVLYAYMAFIVS